jgi:murein DD-endopeptidase MepM/ murein hydrolase activator NlpD
MRKTLTVGALVILLVVAVPFGAFLTARNATPDPCAADGISQPRTIGPVPTVEGLSAVQVRLAKTIWMRAHAQAARLGGHADHAAVIAIAVASQESTLGANPSIARPNADGDAGPFQQRTKPGWYGTLAQVTDAVYAADTFLLGHTVTAAQTAAAHAAGTRPAGPTGYHIPGLVNVAGWADMDIIEAADHVQRSAFPDAVSDDIPLARRLVSLFSSAISGSSVDEIRQDASDMISAGCDNSAPSDCPPTDSPGEARVRPDTLLVLRCVKQAFPKITTFYGWRRFDPYPDHPSGRAVDIMISSAFPNYRSPQAVAYGDQIAAWVKAHQKELGVQYIMWRQHIWNIERANEGWRLFADRGNPTANHLDHVHVTTYGNSAQPTEPMAVTSLGRAVTPVEHYRITAHFGQIGLWARYHTGLDFAAPIGTSARAALDGVVTHAGYGHASWAGKYITIRHPDGTSTLYAHLSATDVVAGESVGTGERIGAIGVTGRSFGPHLHFEAYPPGITPGHIHQAVDPARWLARRRAGGGG